MFKLSRVKSFVGESIDEAKKVVWPTRQQLMGHSIIVVGSVVVTLVAVAALDFGLAYIIKRFILGVY
jgi:preprotein translocase subunit SecE